MALTAYQTSTLRLLHDPGNAYYPTTDVTAYINTARRQIALEGQCIRQLLSGGVITNLTISNAGSGYAGTAVVSIVGSGQQATATATINASQVATITLVNGGWGYLTAPVVTVTGTTGSNAVITPTVDNSASTVVGQEVYNFSTLNTLAQTYSGVQYVAGIFGISVSWGSMKPTLMRKTWPEFQAFYRSYSTGLQNFPSVWSSYGQGVAGSFYLWPLPSQVLQMDVDAYCLPIDLVNDSTPEAIPVPWTDCVPYYAAYLAYSNAQRKEDADRQFAQFTQFMKRARAMTSSPFIENIYDTGW